MQNFRTWCIKVKPLYKEVETIDFPNNPLDDLIIELGGNEKVAEMTGRTDQLVNNGERFSYEKRRVNGASQKNQNLEERRMFQNGDKLIAIISDAASTGFSLHADRTAKNTRRRLQITIDVPW